MNKSALLVVYIMFFFNSCNIENHLNNDLIKTKNINLIQFDFDSAVEHTITKISKLHNKLVSKNILYFVDLPKNNTHLVLNKKNIMNLIKMKLNQKNKNIYFIENKILEKNKKKLGISNTNKNLDIYAALLLSRQNHVKYYLNSTILGISNPYTLKIELILVETGEIIFTEIKKFYYQ